MTNQVASVAVFDGDKLLMGQRRDNRRWTLPGGHVDEGETPTDAAIRELWEEAGIRATQVDFLGSELVVSFTGKTMEIHAFSVNAFDRPTSKNDPDNEVAEWVWVQCRGGLPWEIENNLHSPRNVVLRRLGLQKGLRLEVSDLKKAELTSRPHKYIKKYRGLGGDWIYVYHESGKDPRHLTPEELTIHHRLAELGDEVHKRLKDETTEHPPEKIAMLRQLHDLGDEDAKRTLHSFGINHKAEIAEHNIIGERRRREAEAEAVRNNNELTKNLSGTRLEDLHGAIAEQVESSIFQHLSGHTSSPFYTSLVSAGLTHAKLMDEVRKENNVKDALLALDRELSKVDTVHSTLGQTQNSSARSAGGYGNLAYNNVIKDLQRRDLIPQHFAAADRAILRGFTPEQWKGAHDVLHGQRVERAEAETRRVREETERRERERAEEAAAERELSGSMAKFISTMTDGGMSTREQKRLHRTLTTIFGKNMREEDWPYKFDDVKVTITGVSIGDESLHLDMKATTASGQTITSGWRREWFKRDGNPMIYNSYLKVSESARGTLRIGEQINKNQLKFMKEHAPNGQIAVTANVDVGGYNWANQGFSFKDDSEADLNFFRNGIKSFCREHGVTLTDADMQLFTKPCHFSSFDPGPKVRRTIGGRDVMVHLGKAYMLGKSWYGVMKINKMNDQNVAHKFFQNYSAMKDNTWTKLEPEYTALISAKRGMTPPATPATPAATSAPATPAATSPVSASRVDNAARRWERNGRITLNERRINFLIGLGDAAVTEFLDRHGSKLARGARTRVRNAQFATEGRSP